MLNIWLVHIIRSLVTNKQLRYKFVDSSELADLINPLNWTATEDDYAWPMGAGHYRYMLENASTDTLLSIIARWRTDRKIACIKAVRDATFTGLREAKEFVEQVNRDYNEVRPDTNYEDFFLK